MKAVLVTGATGFLGWHVARRLIEQGVRVRALARDTSRLRELPGVEPVTGDLRDRESLNRAAEGCRVVYHIAADYRLWTRQPEEMYRSNVEGTRGILEASRDAGVERFVYTSTVGCIGMPKGSLGDEDSPVNLDEMAGPYKRSKFLAERVALEFAASGFPVVIVNPTAPVGDHDFKPTPTGKIVVDFVTGKMPAFLDTGLNVVDVRDVAEGHLAACERPGGRTVYSRSGKPDAAADFWDAGGDHRPACSENEDPVWGGFRGGRDFDRMGEHYGTRTSGSAGWSPDGAQENVGDSCKGHTGARLPAGTGTRGACEGSGVV